MQRMGHLYLVGSLCLSSVLLTGCQVSPTATPAPVQPILAPPAAEIVEPPASAPNATTAAPELSQAPLISQRLPSQRARPTPARRPMIVPLPQAAPRSGVRRDGQNIPAFNSLLSIAREQISQAEWADAEQTLTRAQRMAPDSPSVYAYFADIAIRRQQWNRADSMARRGLLLTQNPLQQRTLWHIVLMSAQQQNNGRVIQEAQQQLRRFQ